MNHGMLVHRVTRLYQATCRLMQLPMSTSHLHISIQTHTRLRQWIQSVLRTCSSQSQIWNQLKLTCRYTWALVVGQFLQDFVISSEKYWSIVGRSLTMARQRNHCMARSLRILLRAKSLLTMLCGLWHSMVSPIVFFARWVWAGVLFWQSKFSQPGKTFVYHPSSMYCEL